MPNAKQGRNIMTTNILNKFVQTDIKKEPNSKQTTMKMRRTLVNM
jgi:hypothetical protein